MEQSERLELLRVQGLFAVTCQLFEWTAIKVILMVIVANHVKAKRGRDPKTCLSQTKSTGTRPLVCLAGGGCIASVEY